MCPLLPGQPGELGRHPRVKNTACTECSVEGHRVPKELPKGDWVRGVGGGSGGVRKAFGKEARLEASSQL